LHIEWFKQLTERDAVLDAVARIGIRAQIHGRADRLAHSLNPLAVGIDIAADLDLRRAKALLEPLVGLGRGFRWRENADPRVETNSVNKRTAEILMNGSVQAT